MTYALIGFGIMLLLMLLGLPIGFAMLAVGFVGYGMMTSFKAALGLLSLVPFDQVAVYSMSVIPLFCLMGEFGFRSGVVSDAYTAADRWVGHHRGGLCMATNVACAAFAAMTGSSIAGSSIMTQVAWPEMKKRNYKATLGLGCIAAGGTLGIMIPPSTPMITYGIITNSSVGKLFLAGLLPGIVITVLFCVAVVVVTRIDPLAAHAGKKSGWKERFRSLSKVWLMLVLIVAVLGSIWGGLCTPTEAAAIGSFGTFVIAIGRHNMNLKKIRDSIRSSMKVTSMIFFLLIGASVFSNFITVTKAPVVIAKWVASSNIAPAMLIAIMCLVYIFLGCLMDTLSMILLTLPIFTPIVVALGYDLVWFGILVVLMTMLGSITPPVGINCFVVGGMVDDSTTGEVFKGVVPFIIALLVMAVILVAFPDVALWLPRVLG